MRPSTALLALALLAATLAGCGSPGRDETSPPASQAPTFETLVAHRDGLFVAVPATDSGLGADTFATGFHRGEPTVGVTSDGVLFATASDEGAIAQPPAGGQGLVGRSTDGGKTWSVIQDPIRNAKADVDPWLWVDPATDRLFTGPLYAACSWLAWTDDAGASWGSNPLAGCGVPGHDHQKITTGPPPAGVATVGYPDLVYYAYNSVRPDEGSMVSVSNNGGQLFALPVQAHVKDGCQSGINGPIAAAADGTVYLPKPTCEGLAVAVSHDGGASWDPPANIDDAGMAAHLVTVHASVGTDGVVYAAWTGADELLHLSHSSDQGKTWSAPVVASAPGLKSVAFSALVAGGPDRIALLYVATSDDPHQWSAMDPGVAPDSTVWHAYLATSTDAGSAQPTFTVQRLTTEQDPVQRGCIWLAGGTVACRNLRDFIDLQRDAEGRIIGVYADGCKACASASQRLPLGETVVVVQESGPSLLDGHAVGRFTGQS